MEYKEKYGAWAVILGATEGVGKALAEKLAGLGLNQVLVGRRGALLEELAASLGARFGTENRVIVQDLAEPDAADRVFTETAGLDVGFVSYVAALSVFGRYEKSPYELHARELQINVLTLTRCCYLYYKLFREKGRGCLLNISSASGVNGVPCLTQYGATKAYITHFTRTLAYEAIDTGVDVVVAVLGSTTTPGFLRSQPAGPAGEAAIRNAMTPEDTIEEIFTRWDELPCIVVGERNRETVSPFIPRPSREHMAAMMAMFDR